MKINVQIAEKRFAHFNRLIFKGELPPVPILLSRGRTRIGSCHSTAHRTPTGVVRTDFNLRFSTAYDLKPREWDDIIIHEMIHYYIGVNGYRDTSPHGELFKHFMNEINAKFGRNITISARFAGAKDSDSASQTPSISRPAVKHRYRFVAILSFHDGKQGFKVLPAVYKSVVKYVSAAKRVNEVKAVELYQSCNDFFASFPSSSALKVHLFDEGEYEKVMEGAIRMVILPHIICKASDAG